MGGGFLEKQLMKDIHATSETVAVVDGDLEGAAVSGSKSKAEEGDFDISGRGIGAAANLDFVQASLRAESRGACSAVAGGGADQFTSRLYSLAEMECCGDLQLVSTGGVALCHPYALGRYRKIGVCGGRSFYQHSNNSDIFLYHACAAWYVGLEASHYFFL